MASWPEWNSDTAWVRLDGDFGPGATGKLKPKGGPPVRFVVERVVPGREFVDVSMLWGARLTFDHRITTVKGGNRIDVTISIRGRLAWLWRRILGKDLARTLPADLAGLVAAAERHG